MKHDETWDLIFVHLYPPTMDHPQWPDRLATGTSKHSAQLGVELPPRTYSLPAAPKFCDLNHTFPNSTSQACYAYTQITSVLCPSKPKLHFAQPGQVCQRHDGKIHIRLENKPQTMHSLPGLDDKIKGINRRRLCCQPSSGLVWQIEQTWVWIRSHP